MRTRQVGRTPLPIIDEPADLLDVLELQDALWVATAAPLDTLRGDPVFLRALDADGDGRIRSDEVRAAIRWLVDALVSLDALAGSELSLDTLSDTTEGRRLHAAATRALELAERPQAASIDLATVRDVRSRQEARGLSAAGMALPEAGGGDPSLRGLIQDIIRVTGGSEHPSGARAVTLADLERFLAQAKAWITWWRRGHTGDSSDTLRPLGDGTRPAAEAMDAIAPKIDQFWLLCDALALDPSLESATRLDAGKTDLLDTEAARDLLRRAPLAPPHPGGRLERHGATNPVWRDELEALFVRAVRPLLGERDSLERADWEALQARLAPWRDWRANAPDRDVAVLGPERVQALLADEVRLDTLRARLDESQVAARELADVKDVEELLLHQAHLLRFCRSFVTMSDLYAIDRRALFERGQLVMDGRVFDLAVKVTDQERALTFGGRSPMYILYVDVGAKAGTFTEQVAVPVTAGEAGNLVEGAWGLFHDVDGRPMHARVNRIAASPISIREALLTPFRRLNEVIQKAADRAASTRTTAMDEKLEAAAEKGVTRAEQALVQEASATAAPPAKDGPLSGSNLPLLLAGGGVALAALGSTLTYAADRIWTASTSLANGFLALPFVSGLEGEAGFVLRLLAAPLALVVVLLGLLLVPFLVYALPVTFATWLRLRKRDLAALLEGSGWAINRRLLLTREQARWYTRTPR